MLSTFFSYLPVRLCFFSISATRSPAGVYLTAKRFSQFLVRVRATPSTFALLHTGALPTSLFRLHHVVLAGLYLRMFVIALLTSTSSCPAERFWYQCFSFMAHNKFPQVDLAPAFLKHHILLDTEVQPVGLAWSF